jgi:hypothetical protein
LEVYEREARVGTREVWIEGNSPLKQVGGGNIVHTIETIQVLQAQVVSGPRIEVFARAMARERGLMDRYVNFERHEDPRTEVLAHGMNIVDSSRKSLGPDDAAVSGIYELNRNHNTSV